LGEDVFVITEQRNGKLQEISLELVSEGRRLAKRRKP
jgi:hypothetical protein